MPYGSSYLALTYVSTPSLITGDSLTGALSPYTTLFRSFYNITQGNLALSPNYTLAFTPGVQFEIKKLTVTVTPDRGQTKIYGSHALAPNYVSTLALITGDSFTGALARDPGTSVGFYNIT